MSSSPDFTINVNDWTGLKALFSSELIHLIPEECKPESTGQACYENIALSGIDVLKASHHGRKYGYYWKAVRDMAPWLTITSVTEKAYDATSNYRRYSDYTVSLRDTKDIQIMIDDDGRLYYPTHIKEFLKPNTVTQNALSNDFYSSLLSDLLQQR